ISGHKMYVGSCSRPNLFTWFITMNGPSLSRDLAQRCINIILKRPKHSGTWYEDVTGYSRKYRDEIVAVIAAFFERERQTISYPSRWGLWEREVLSRVSDPDRVSAIIRTREATNDEDRQQAMVIEELISANLSKAGYVSPYSVHISNERIAEW